MPRGKKSPLPTPVQTALANTQARRSDNELQVVTTRSKNSRGSQDPSTAQLEADQSVELPKVAEKRINEVQEENRQEIPNTLKLDALTAALAEDLDLIRKDDSAYEGDFLPSQRAGARYSHLDGGREEEESDSECNNVAAPYNKSELTRASPSQKPVFEVTAEKNVHEDKVYTATQSDDSDDKIKRFVARLDAEEYRPSQRPGSGHWVQEPWVQFVDGEMVEITDKEAFLRRWEVNIDGINLIPKTESNVTEENKTVIKSTPKIKNVVNANASKSDWSSRLRTRNSDGQKVQVRSSPKSVDASEEITGSGSKDENVTSNT
ncbi:hypothetical protein BD410DRAFT_845784 [Rickenella mellea]|uniref:Uncharacterized protein n=1 Tax=Rickenella mellea TaxID=50990 RepID=A0A4Y7PI63_9AGAM|nr:hypothetical protein BD410DRAFT_845784 [Rickenella mellea]